MSEDILPSHRNKHLMLWFVENGLKHQVALHQGYSNITETFAPENYSSLIFMVHIPYVIQRMGFSKNAYEANGKEYWKMVFMEKSKGTFFG